MKTVVRDHIEGGLPLGSGEGATAVVGVVGGGVEGEGGVVGGRVEGGGRSS